MYIYKGRNLFGDFFEFKDFFWLGMFSLFFATFGSWNLRFASYLHVICASI